MTSSLVPSTCARVMANRAEVLHTKLAMEMCIRDRVQAVQTFTTLTERVVVLRRVPLDCALLAFAVCCICLLYTSRCV